ncbi:hypothetical protein [Sphingobacterium sp. MYb382]|uniref:hypothetical protein n=1 Tax=Sphingobacterium sp. MYb382 TaxID=2745278 RepID=UPI0030A94426
MFIGLLGLTWGALQGDGRVFLILQGIFLFMLGVGIGMGWPHLLTRVFSLAPKGEEALTSASVTTVQLMATTFGAALAGLVVNMGGINQSGGAEQASFALYGVFAMAPFLALLIHFFKK